MERRLKQALREGLIQSDYLGDQIEEAAKAGVITKAEAGELRDYHDKVRALLAVDDFAPEEIGRQRSETPGVQVAAAKKKNVTREKTAKKTTTRKKASKKARKKTA